MQFQIDVSPTFSEQNPDTPPAPPPVSETVELLRQLLEVQREQLVQQRAAAASHDMVGRWRAFLTRWDEEFPGLPGACRKTLPYLERAYIRLIAEMVERLEEEEDSLESDFALQEYLDRYGMRLAQLGTLLNLLAPLAEAGPPGETAG